MRRQQLRRLLGRSQGVGHKKSLRHAALRGHLAAAVSAAQGLLLHLGTPLLGKGCAWELLLLPVLLLRC